MLAHTKLRKDARTQRSNQKSKNGSEYGKPKKCNQAERLTYKSRLFKEENRENEEKEHVESSFPYFLSPFTGLQAQSDLYIGGTPQSLIHCHIVLLYH